MNDPHRPSDDNAPSESDAGGLAGSSPQPSGSDTSHPEPGPDHLRPTSPFTLSLHGFWRVTKRVVAQIGEDSLSLVAAGVAFYLLLAMIPAVGSLVSIYGMLSSPAEVSSLVAEIGRWAPQEVTALLSDQLQRITQSSNTALSFGALFALLLSIWSVNRGTKSLIEGLNIAYDEKERRNIVWLNLASMGITFVVLLFVAALSVTLSFVLSFVPTTDQLGTLGQAAVTTASWIGMSAAILAVLAFIYRFGPNRSRPHWVWVSPGSVLALAGLIGGSRLFALYAEHFASYNETFGALSGVVVTLTWLWLSAFCVLLGAEVNAELEHETLYDTTVGPQAAIGERGAYVADDVPPGVQSAWDAHREHREHRDQEQAAS